jgi:hypothetical protein
LEGQLRQTVDRLKGLGGAVVFEDYPGVQEDEGQGEVGSDAGSINEERELIFTVRGRLIERANRLAEALDRLGSGQYADCQVCGDPIAPGHPGSRDLRGMPGCGGAEGAHRAGASGGSLTTLSGSDAIASSASPPVGRYR